MEFQKYNLEDMIDWLITYFNEKGYEEKKYWSEFRPARVPLYFKKEVGDKVDEIVIDLTTDAIITEKIFLQEQEISGIKIDDAAPVNFYQYYFIQAKVYFVFPDYAKDKTKGFKKFKSRCGYKGIGLLKIGSETKIEEILKPRPMLDTICAELGLKKSDEKIDKLEYHLRNCLHYFVYYPGSIFTTKGIAYIHPEKPRRNYIGYQITDLLSTLKNIAYKSYIMDLSKRYRITGNRSGGKIFLRKKLGRDDFELASQAVTKLWDKYLGLKFPNIQQKIDIILQKDQTYREHFVHQFKVFLIGSYILDLFYPIIASKFSTQYKCNIEKVWLVASTFHDFSYGLQNFDTWLTYFFEETLKVKEYQTKENLNLLNLDAAMIREAIYGNIIKIVENLPFDLKKENKEPLIRFFYEKAVTDRNHGILSAISLLQLYYNDIGRSKLTEQELLHAAAAITLHEEDVWEALCGCQGYRGGKVLSSNEEECAKDCKRNLWSRKQKKIVDEKLSYMKPSDEIAKYKCERWEKAIMDKRLLEKITFVKNPLVFLLIFCDSVQDEGRVASSDDQMSRDRSSLEGISFDKAKGGQITQITVSLSSNEENKKELELKRLAWCLQDDRFRVQLNDKLEKMNGSGG